MSEADGCEAGVEGTATVGAAEPAGVLHATTAPPSDAARARASRIRLIMTEDSSDARAPAGPVPRVAESDHEV
jgi:hypothetical protein